jgi:hypothetical protein
MAMADGERFLRIVKEMLTWGSASGDLFNRIGVAVRMPTTSESNKMDLANVSSRIGGLFYRAGEIMDGDDLDKLNALTDQLRHEVVSANVILDRLKVPDGWTLVLALRFGNQSARPPRPSWRGQHGMAVQDASPLFVCPKKLIAR